jgi:hypothetical protein
LVIKENEYSPKFGIVSFLDILGTKSIWEDNKAQEFLTKVDKLYDEFEVLSEELSEKMLLLKNTNYKIGNTESMPFKENGTIPQLGIDISTFSDTIILALYGDFPISDSFFLYLTSFFLIPLFGRAFVQRIYLRGTLSIGKFFLLKRNNGVLLVGPAVNDAAQSYENADWIGISASPNASLTLEQEHTFDEILGIDIDNLKNLFSIVKNCFIQYDIPTKNTAGRNGWALAWPNFFDGGDFYHTQKEIKQVFDEELSYQKYQQTSISNDIYRKFRNTKDFFDFSIREKGLIDCDSIQN